jgi:hypothetical protein
MTGLSKDDIVEKKKKANEKYCTQVFLIQPYFSVLE